MGGVTTPTDAGDAPTTPPREVTQMAEARPPATDEAAASASVTRRPSTPPPSVIKGSAGTEVGEDADLEDVDAVRKGW